MKFDANPDVLAMILQNHGLKDDRINLMVFDDFMGISEGIWFGFGEEDYSWEMLKLWEAVGLLEIEDQRCVDNGLWARVAQNVRMEYTGLQNEYEGFEMNNLEEYAQSLEKVFRENDL